MRIVLGTNLYKGVVIKTINQFFKQQNNRRGFTLMEIMIAVGILGIVSLVLLQVMKDTAKTNVKGEIDDALAQVQTEILTYITTPFHCNANFFNLTSSTTPVTIATGIKHCTSTIPVGNKFPTGSCRLSIGGVASVVKIPVTTISWDPAVTKLSDRVRLSALSYELIEGPVVPVGPGPGTGIGILQNIKLNATFQIKEMTGGLKTVQKTFNTAVVLNGNTVKGCPKTVNSTVPY